MSHKFTEEDVGKRVTYIFKDQWLPRTDWEIKSPSSGVCVGTITRVTKAGQVWVQLDGHQRPYLLDRKRLTLHALQPSDSKSA